jgi:hypothetical protein
LACGTEISATPADLKARRNRKTKRPVASGRPSRLQTARAQSAVTFASNVKPVEAATSAVGCARISAPTPLVSGFKDETMGPREALARISTMINAGLACDDVGRIHALLRDMKLTAEQAISRRGLRRGRVRSLTNRSLNTGARVRPSSSARS